MRAQSGTTSLRALLYMDEIFGYFPPTANPPSKIPLLTLMKQARAFGLGVVVATQNPVDIDYKGLSNAGTWFLGRLQTERDKLRVLDGLEGASSAAGKTFNRSRMEQILSSLGNRVFLMNNVHEDEPVVFQTRWALSFLRGPLTRDQISELMQSRKLQSVAGGSSVSSMSFNSEAAAGARPILPPDVPELFLAQRGLPDANSRLVYRPALLGNARVHYASTANGVDYWRELTFLLPIDEGATDFSWDDAQAADDWQPDFDQAPESATAFATLPTPLAKAKQYAAQATALKDYLYRTNKLTLWKAPALKQVSEPNESEGDFRVRISQSNKERRDLDIEKLRAKYAPKLAAVQEQIRKAEQRVEKEHEQSKGQMLTAALSVGSSILGAMFGRKLATATNLGRAVSSAKAASKVMNEKADVNRAQETVGALTEKFNQLNTEFEAEVTKLQAAASAEAIELQEITVSPKKSDITVTRIALLWTPWSCGADGTIEALFDSLKG
jgi:phage host-nuclease inhibitor protein Gam